MTDGVCIKWSGWLERMDRAWISVEQVALLRWTACRLRQIQACHPAFRGVKLFLIVTEKHQERKIYCHVHSCKILHYLRAKNPHICTCTHAISNLELVEGHFAILPAQLSGISQTLRNVVRPTHILAPLTDALIFRETSILLGTSTPSR